MKKLLFAYCSEACWCWRWLPVASADNGRMAVYGYHGACADCHRATRQFGSHALLITDRIACMVP
jgi:hypothetical protein